MDEDDDVSVSSSADAAPTFDVEVDWDYEYDAPKWFDLSRKEPAEAVAGVELWFFSAPGYGPSPIIAQMFAEDMRATLPRSTANADVGHCSTSDMHDVETRNHYTQRKEPCNTSRIDRKSRAKGPVSKGSTLMKPTLSHLAKQTQRHQLNTLPQDKKPLGVKLEKNVDAYQNCTVQAAKRQKLESGHLSKVLCANPPEYAHKTREKNVDHLVGQSAHPRVRLTVPREPNLETRRRAERARTQKVGHTNQNQYSEGNVNTVPMSQLGTSNRDTKLWQPRQAECTNSILSVCTTNQCSPVQNSKRSEARNFKPWHADKKILPIKGDIGAFQGAKRSTTVPKEFKLSTSTKHQQAPPLSELFNKLSLSSEAHRIAGSYETLLPIHITTKDSKENMSSCTFVATTGQFS